MMATAGTEDQKNAKMRSQTLHRVNSVCILSCCLVRERDELRTATSTKDLLWLSPFDFISTTKLAKVVAAWKPIVDFGNIYFYCGLE